MLSQHAPACAALVAPAGKFPLTDAPAADTFRPRWREANMFEGIRRLWAEARADVVSKQANARADVISQQVDDILQRYQRMNPNDRHRVFSAFNSVLSEVQDQLGSVAQWSTEQKKQTAKRIMLSSQKAFTTRGSNIAAETTQLSAYGGALLSLYLELLALPGDRAARVAEAIENWSQTNEGA